MEDRYLLAGVIIVCLTVLEIFAIYQGIDGVVFGTLVATLAGVLGALLGIKGTKK